MGTQHNVAFGDFGMGDLLKKVETIEEQCEKLNQLTRKIKIDHEESKNLTRVATREEIMQRRKKHMNEILKIVSFIKSKFEELNEENLTNRHKPECGKGSVVDRSRTTITLSLKKNLRGVMSKLLALIESICQERREELGRDYYTVMGTKADKETIDRLIETGDIRQIREKAILGKMHAQFLEAYEGIKVHRDILRELDKKILDLQEVFEYVADQDKAPKMKSLQKNSGKSMCIII